MALTGDLDVKGDAYFSDGTDNYLFVDTQDRFMGINTLEVLNNYNTEISNLKYANYNLSQQNVVFSSDFYPNFVGDRNALKEAVLDASGNLIGSNNEYFSPLAPMTSRRTSNYFTFQEMYDIAETYTTPVEIGLYTMTGQSTITDPQTTTYHYGASTSYEVKDKTGYTNLLGRTYMCIDEISPIDPTVTRAGFGIQVVDNDDNSNYRDLLYLDTKSQLYINSIKLGGYNNLSTYEVPSSGSSPITHNLLIQQDISGVGIRPGSINFGFGRSNSVSSNTLSIDRRGNLLIQSQDVSGNFSTGKINLGFQTNFLNPALNIITQDTSGNILIQSERPLGTVNASGSINLGGLTNGGSNILTVDASGNLVFNGQKVAFQP